MTRRRRRWRGVLVICGIVVLALAGTAVAGVYVLSERLAGNVERIPSVFTPLDPDQRPPRPPEPSLTFLLAGSDSRSDEPTTGAGAARYVPGAQRSDTMMLVRLDPSRTRASVVSFPRDSWVPVPGHGLAKINAAFSYGGPTLMVRTVEALTGIRIDHFAAIDFAGFRTMVDAVGGIDVVVERATSHGDVRFDAGTNHLDGRQALLYVRQRHGLPRGDLDRVRRQQNALRAWLTKASSLSDPLSVNRTLDALTTSVSVDDTLDNGALRSLAVRLRQLSSVTFLTAPVAGLGREGAQSVVYLDHARCARLWQAVGADDVDAYARENAGDVLGGSPR